MARSRDMEEDMSKRRLDTAKKGRRELSELASIDDI